MCVCPTLRDCQCTRYRAGANTQAPDNSQSPSGLHPPDPVAAGDAYAKFLEAMRAAVVGAVDAAKFFGIDVCMLTTSAAQPEAAAKWVGCSSRRRLINIDVKPYTALVACPLCVLKFSAGSA